MSDASADAVPPARSGIRGLLADPTDRRLFVILVGLVLAIVVSVGGWWAWTSYAVGKVDVAVTQGPTCTGTTVRPNGNTIVSKPGMSCVYTVTVHNDGPLGMRLDRAVLTVLGPGGGATVMAAGIDGRAPEDDGDVDAQIPLDHELGAGKSWSFRVRVVFRPDGCTAPGRMGVDDWPTVVTDILGRDMEIHGDSRFAIYAERQNPDCDS